MRPGPPPGAPYGRPAYPGAPMPYGAPLPPGYAPGPPPLAAAAEKDKHGLSTGAKVGLSLAAGVAAGVLAVKAEEKVHDWGHKEKMKLENDLHGLEPHGSVSFNEGSNYSTAGHVAGAGGGGRVVEYVETGPTFIGGGGRVVEYVETGPTFIGGGTTYIGGETIIDNDRVVENTTVIENK